MSENQLTVSGAANLPAFMQGEAANFGREQVQEVQFRLNLHLCQGLSPEVVEGDAKAGDYIVRPLGKNLGQRFEGVVIHFEREFIQWAPRQGQEGYDPEADPVVARWKPKDVPIELTKFVDTPDGKSIPPVAKETFNFVLLVYGEGGEFIQAPIVLSLAKASAKTGAKVAGDLNLYGGPICGAVFEFTSTTQEVGGHNVKVSKAKMLRAFQDNETDKAHFFFALDKAKFMKEMLAGGATIPASDLDE